MLAYLYFRQEKRQIQKSIFCGGLTIKNPYKFLIFACLFIILVVTPVVLNFYYNYLLKPLSANDTPQIFIVKPGQPIISIAQNLQNSGLIKSAFAFRLLVAQMGIGKNIQAGDFRLSQNMPAREIAAQLTHGAIDIWITFPEGLRKEEAAQIIEAKLNISSNENYLF